MNMFGVKVWYYTLDPELRLIHCASRCTGLKIAGKYGYAKEFKLHEGNELEALQLDELVTHKGYRPCHNCWKIEQGLAKKDHRAPRPGFKKEPRA